MALRSRFLDAEERFLSAFSSGPDATSAFSTEWHTLLADLTRALEAHEADACTLSLAHTVSSRIAVLAETLVSLDAEASQSRNVLKADCDRILSESYPSLDISSQRWLLHNLHDPYPSSAMKATIAESCSCSVKDVRDWFADARRRIGWTALLAERFGGSRREASKAASRAYSEDAFDDSLPLDVRHAFAAIKANSHSLFNDDRTFGSPSESQNSPLQTSNSKLFLDVSKEESDEDSWTSLSRPSSPNSRAASSLTPSSNGLSVDEQEDEDTTPPPPIAGRKRRLDMSTEIEEGRGLLSSATTRPSKRHRYMCLTTDTSSSKASKPSTPGNGLPLSQHDTSSVSTPAQSTIRMATSLSPSIIGIPSIAEATENASCAVDPAPAFVSRSPRKRRLSDSSAGNPPKRPRGLGPAPRRQAVSDPLPVSLSFAGSEMHTLPEWLQSSFDIPYAAELGDLDHSLAYDVELATFPLQPSEATFPTASLGPVSLASECHVSDADLVSATHEGFDFSAYNSHALLASGFGFEHNFDVVISDGSSASSPSSASSYSELSDYGLPANASNVDWTKDWSQFLNILDSLGSSPTSSQSSLSDSVSPPCPTTSGLTSTPSLDDVTQTLSGVDPPFTSSDLLSGIDGFSSLHLPLEAIFMR